MMFDKISRELTRCETFYYTGWFSSIPLKLFETIGQKQEWSSSQIRRCLWRIFSRRWDFFVPFPELPRINVTHLQLAGDNLAKNVTQQWEGNYRGCICSSTVVTYRNLTDSAVFELKNYYERLQQDNQLFKNRMSLFNNHSKIVQEVIRQQRQVNVLLAAEAALILGPIWRQ